MNEPSIGHNRQLADHALKIRKNAVRQAAPHGQGFVGQALGAADILTVAFFHAMRYRADEPSWEGRDRFFLSAGHCGISLYSALAEAGFFPVEELDTYGCDDSRLPMSSMWPYTPGVEMSGGSIGLGLPMAVGTALGLRLKKSDAFVYAMMGDGELGEGPTWEAAQAAVHHRLSNIVALVDVNGVQADGRMAQVLCTEPLHDKWAAFGWYVQRVDGNDIPALVDAFDKARDCTEAKPRIILCDTRMGHGIPFIEAREKLHFVRLEPEDWQRAFEVLDAGRDE
jgi:transketolase